MQSGNRFRCYPTTAQAQILLQWIGCQRHIYNAKVREDQYFRRFARKSLQHAGQFAPIDQQYAQFKTELTPWLSDVPSVVLRNGAVKWKQAYSRFFSKLGGRPVVHKNHGKQAVWLTSELFEFVPVTDKTTGEISHQLRVGTKKYPLGMLDFKAHKAYTVPASIHISIHAGQWHVSFNCDDGIPEPSDNETTAWLQQFNETELRKITAGLDRGVNILLAGSEGQKFDFMPIQKKRLTAQDLYKKRWQRRQARRIKGSGRWVKAKRRVAGHQRYGADVRREVAHQASAALASDPRYSLFVFEALKVKNMTASAKGTMEAPGKNVRQKAGLNRSILASSWGQTKTYLQYKARRRGKLCVDVPPQYSSQECSACGHIHQDNRQSQSLFVCLSCGYTDNADRNAGKVLAMRGVRLLLSGNYGKKEKKRCAITRIKVGAEGSEPAVEMQPTCVETEVSRLGSNILSHWSLKRETPATSHQWL
jgi:putative transposase